MMSLITRGRATKQVALAASASLMLMVNHHVLKKEGEWEEQDSCDGAFLHSSPIHSKFSLKRHSTIARLEQLADESSLASKYHIYWREPLGEGAFGAVYSAVDRNTGERVAVKQINKRYTDNATFAREIEALLLLRENGGHPNICSVRENYDEGDSYYIVLDLVSGREMFDQLCHQGPYSEADAARLVQELASALAFLHGIGITHSDVKPENLMLSTRDNKDAVIKLVDLGCAHFVGVPNHDQRPKGTANTPAYCPPEVLLETRRQDGGHVTMEPSFDMWSLGIVIYIMLVGVHPFDLYGTASDKEIEEKIIAGEKPPLHGFRHAKHLSEDAMALIEGLMESDPNKRLTAQQVLENRWVRGETATNSETQIGSTFFKTLLSQKVIRYRL